MMRSLELPLLLLLAVNCGVFIVPSESLKIEVAALTAFKRAIFEDPHSVLSDWHGIDADPCRWSGITCSKLHNNIISVNLSNSSLKGFLAPELGLLTSLQELILSNNLLIGTIPQEICTLKRLNLLDLSANRLTGPIPTEIGNLTSVTKIDLHSNELTGTIPPEFGSLMSLLELRLDRNRLEGSIPGTDSSKPSSTAHGKFASQNHRTGLCLSPLLKVADFSYNYFVGKIPPCLKPLIRSSFQGNCLQDKDAVLQLSSEKCASSKSQAIPKVTYRHSNGGPKHQKSQQPEWLLILEFISGTIMVICFFTAAAAAVKRCTPKASSIIPWMRDARLKDHITISIDGEMLKNTSTFSRLELELACEDFSNIIGSSPYSIIYKGTMKDGPEIAVLSLCISEDHWTNYLEFYFQTKVADLARLHHDNVAKMLGYCRENDPFSRMLVVDYASNGTLYEHLHYGEGCRLSWLRRMKIVIGIARGLRYLHTELHPPFALSELNSTAIYLTEDFTPKLADFESWKVMFSKSEDSNLVANGGPFYGLVDCMEQRHKDIQGNTYAFGVLLLEIISGRPPYCKERGCLVDWATEYLQNPEQIGNLVDPELSYVKREDLAVICSVVSLCIEADPSKRPSMQILSAVLENGIDISADAVLKDSPWAELALSSEP